MASLCYLERKVLTKTKNYRDSDVKPLKHQRRTSPTLGSAHHTVPSKLRLVSRHELLKSHPIANRLPVVAKWRLATDTAAVRKRSNPTAMPQDPLTLVCVANSTGPGRCFPFWQEVLACYVVNADANDASGAKKCNPALEDYYECLHHKKEVTSDRRLGRDSYHENIRLDVD